MVDSENKGNEPNDKSGLILLKVFIFNEWVKTQLQDKDKPSGWRVFKVSLGSYAPAFLLVLACFGLFSLSRCSNAPKPEASIPLPKEVKQAVDSAAKNEVEKIKADLYGQITFPVVFAIASIFAAFAVKDIITEILKNDEKKEVINQIKEEIEGKISSELSKNTKEIDQKLNLINEHVNANLAEEKQTLEAQVTTLSRELAEDIKNNIKELEMGLNCLSYELTSLTAEIAYSKNSDQAESKDEFEKYMQTLQDRIVSVLGKIRCLDENKNKEINIMNMAHTASISNITGRSQVKSEVDKPKQNITDSFDETFKIKLKKLDLIAIEIQDNTELDAVYKGVKQLLSEHYMRTKDAREALEQMDRGKEDRPTILEE